MLLDLLRADGSIVVNKRLAREIGLHEAIILSESISRFAYHKGREELTKDGMFYLTVEKLEEFTTLSKHIQGKAIKTLKALGFLDTKQIGMPSKRYFKINEQAIIDFLMSKLSTDKEVEEVQESPSNQGSEKLDNKEVKNSPPRSEKIDQQEGEKLTTSNTKDNTKDNTEIHNTNLNNIYQSNSVNNIDSELNEIPDQDLPMIVKKQISVNQKRLIEDNVSTYEILAFYKSSENTVSESNFAMILSNVLKKTKGSINSFHAVMKTAIKNWYDEYTTTVAPAYDEMETIEPAGIDKDKLPEYLKYDFLGGDR